MKLGNKGRIDVIGMVGFVLLLMVGVIIFAEFDEASDSLGTTTAGTAAIDNVTVNTYSGFNVLSVSPLVYASVIVLGVVALLGRKK